jgi:hypothetical protein
MPRCPDCNKFTEKDTEPEPDVMLDVEYSGRITGDVRIANNCAECSTELEEFNFTVDYQNLEDAVAAHNRIHTDEQPGPHSLDLSHEEFERTDRTETTGKNGRPIKPRYARRYYGYSGDVRVTCTCGKFEVIVELEDEVTAGSMESTV